MASSSKRGNLADRMKHLLGTAKLADAHFLVGDGDGKELLSAHKSILVSASDVFEAMFRFDSQNGKAEKASVDNPVEVPDVEAAAFKVMLSFIYADDLSELDGENAMAVLCAAHKYGIDGLISHCVQIPIQNLPNVFLAHSMARLFNLEDFAHQCLRYICQNFGKLFETDEFYQIDQSFLCELFERDHFFPQFSALRWADVKCRQNAIECSAENRRDALGPALFKIRFPLISTKDFNTSIVPSGILTNDEFDSVNQFHCLPNLHDAPVLKPLEFAWHGRVSDWIIANANWGTLTMKIEKFSEFTKEKVESRRNSEAVQMKGFEWKISAEITTDEKDGTDKYLGFYLLCFAPPKNDGICWSCECSATLRIVSQNSGTADFSHHKFDRIFNNKANSWGFPKFTSTEFIMDPDKGLYDSDEDKVTLAVDLTVEEK
ncbi:hypothetical protein niasHS_018155 [Heterodera schachtii]|uniref:BTB domain-containing protein n=1 Tax=Heterodera schachtii TaxID=97005 RepID=A0ABD2HX18_HETSC